MMTIPADVDLSALGVYNVKSFGAVGDGATDDTVAIQSAIIAAYVAGGGIVYLPKSRYLINGGPIDKGTVPGDTTGARCYGIGMLPSDITWAPNSDLATAGYSGPNFPPTLHSGFGGTLPDETTIPNGPVLLFDNVTLIGDGPDTTVLLAGEQIYNGWIFNPQGQIYPPPPMTGTLVPRAQLGAIISSWNNWAAWPLTIASGAGYDADGFAAHNCYVRNLTIDCQGKFCVNAGKPLHIYASLTFEDHLNNIGDNAIMYADGTDGETPWGELYGDAVSLQIVENCGIDNVWVKNGNVNGVNLTGTQNLDAHANGPVPISYQQVTGPDPVNPDGLDVYVPPIVAEKDSSVNVPTINGFITNCHVDMNYPWWLAGTRPQSGHGNTGGSDGSLPVRAIGCAVVTVSNNRVGVRNQPSSFGTFPAPAGYSNYPDVPPNTKDAMDCPGCWHILVTGNLLTNCGDAVGALGNGDMTISGNLFYNFGSVGIDAPRPGSPTTQRKAISQTKISDNIFFLSSDSGAPQIAIYIDDNTGSPSGQSFGAGSSTEQATSQQGDIIISDNLFYAPGNNTVINLFAWGAIVKGNVFDFAGQTPYENPVYNPGGMGVGSSSWPIPNCVGIAVKGNDIVIEGNIFRNAAPAGSVNANVTGILFPTGFPPAYQTGDSTRAIVRGNIFDGTIGDPIKDNSGGGAGGVLIGARILDNIGINPAGALDPSLVPVPLSSAPFANPYPYDCFVNITTGTAVVSVALYNSVTFASIAASQQKAFLVKAGGTITLTYPPLPSAKPSWLWIGL